VGAFTSSGGNPAAGVAGAFAGTGNNSSGFVGTFTGHR
jgi:hypothetical protein